MSKSSLVPGDLGNLVKAEIGLDDQRRTDVLPDIHHDKIPEVESLGYGDPGRHGGSNVKLAARQQWINSAVPRTSQPVPKRSSCDIHNFLDKLCDEESPAVFDPQQGKSMLLAQLEAVPYSSQQKNFEVHVSGAKTKFGVDEAFFPGEKHRPLSVVSKPATGKTICLEEFVFRLLDDSCMTAPRAGYGMKNVLNRADVDVDMDEIASLAGSDE